MVRIRIEEIRLPGELAPKYFLDYEVSPNCFKNHGVYTSKTEAIKNVKSIPKEQ